MANSNLNFVKRKRSANWDALEKSLLKSCMKEFVSVIDNKNTDLNTNKSPKPLSPDPETIDILSMIPQEFETDFNVFDSDTITHPEVQSQEKSSVNTITQEYVITPGDNNDNVQENITPLPFKMQNEKDRMKRKLSFNCMNDNIHTNVRIET
ncbi:unnamed protein product [Parnassius apollo]|uniref:(apollo) hypothetical protein n=1 Tax=Parnassius apollo TaxID=110799 RepID=A0A8S3XX37_PARAO|nr:unnamed protein product [Parnassius apollo]